MEEKARAHARLIVALVAPLVATLAGLVLGSAPAAATQPDRFLAGTGIANITPPLARTPAGLAADKQFAPQFTRCPETSFPTPGRFALQEPFQDLNGDDQWDPGANLNTGPTGQKPDPFCDANGNGRWDGIYSDNEFGPERESTTPSRLGRSPSRTAMTCRWCTPRWM